LDGNIFTPQSGAGAELRGSLYRQPGTSPSGLSPAKAETRLHYKKKERLIVLNAHQPFNQYWAMPEVDVEVAYLCAFLRSSFGLVAEHLLMLYFFCVESGSWFLMVCFQGLLSLDLLLSQSGPRT